MVQRTVLDEQTGSIEFEPARPSLTNSSSEERGMSGRAALAQALRDVSFPATKQNLIRSVGDRTVEFRRGQPIRMKDALERAEPTEFLSLLDAAREIHRALDERRQDRREAPPAGQ
jgi:hypothetical protein